MTGRLHLRLLLLVEFSFFRTRIFLVTQDCGVVIAARSSTTKSFWKLLHQALCDTQVTISNFALFDKFVYNSHPECVGFIKLNTISSASHYLFTALDGRAFLRSATVVLPSSWPDSCAPKPVVSGSGETPDVTILPREPTRGRIWTQQSAGCGQPGDQIYFGYESLLGRDDSLGRTLVKEFAKYRYGVFEEQGYYNDPVYPTCFYDDQTRESRITGCSDYPIKNTGICENPSAKYNVTEMVEKDSRSSIMFAAEAPSVTMFCDEGNHDRYAPTKHNQICNRRNTYEVIMSHRDFAGSRIPASSDITNTTPKMSYVRQNITRYMVIIENTKDMLQRESWNYLRVAIRKWAWFDLPENTEVGVLLANETGATKLGKIVTLKNSGNRDVLSSNIPYTPGDSIQPACLHCALRIAVGVLNEANKYRSAARNVIILIAPGLDQTKELDMAIEDAKKLKIKIATVNYPYIFRSQPLDFLAIATDGAAFTVTEAKNNIETSLLTTYFQLTNVFYSITERFYSGNPSDLPMEIHRRKLSDDGRSSITGSFVLEENMSEPAKFMLYTHNAESPLIHGLTLISPSHQEFTVRSESMLGVKIITLVANISEPGTWTYTVERYSGNPQPHFIQVMATPKSRTVPVVRAKFWVHRNQPNGPLILFAEVKRGNFPVLSAKVEAVFTKDDRNTTMPYSGTLELLDRGNGDPDITKGDGIYSRYFSAAPGGPGTYTFEVTITDNGNTAYTWMYSSKIGEDKPCCGSVVPTSSVQTLSPFQRSLPPVTMVITSEDILKAGQIAVGRIGDLRVQVKPEDMKAHLSWTSPDMGGNKVARYEIKYAKSLKDIVDEYDTLATIWEHANPHSLAPGSETTVTVDMTKERHLLDQPLYFAVRAYPQLYSDSQATEPSNWVRLLVPSPPPPPTVPPTFPTSDHSSWPHNHISSVGIDPITPTMNKAMPFGLEIVLPVVIGILILAIIVALYCYFCIIKKRVRDNHKKSAKHSNGLKTDKLNSAVTIVPGTPSHSPQSNTSQAYTNIVDVPNPHTVGVPINDYTYEDDTKKRYSLVHQQEQQLIEELKQQHFNQQQHDQLISANNNYGGVSVISNNSLQRNGGHTLSPYNSWSASQLLHEHERRHSPLDNMIPEDQMMSAHQDMMMNGSQVDHMSIGGQTIDHSGHHISNPVPEHYIPGHAPPVPPLPAYSANGYPVNYNIYGVQQTPQMMAHPNNQPIYQTMQRNDAQGNYNTSLQGSLSSVNSGEKKRRNVTMV
ncbi:calcium-activated chloride channel regulator 4 isoform X1 [Agrilus planipennis]|uniref:Calcium-activated chloride channel regulator 4 isoform X1 n=1 Tax=Agrilus planipennis TaxID=224129 RepID=A0A7F5RM35_AGRPL|nr:calcium-activated chloride channel regulator 4 isoform X1 [Agrilus planipennis]